MGVGDLGDHHDAGATVDRVLEPLGDRLVRIIRRDRNEVDGDVAGGAGLVERNDPRAVLDRGGDHSIARREREPGEHDADADTRARGDRDLVRLRAEDLREQLAEALLALSGRVHHREGGGAVGQLEVEHRFHRLGHSARRRGGEARVQVGVLLERRDVGAELFPAIGGHLALGCYAFTGFSLSAPAPVARPRSWGAEA